jgi:hypothetical protein
MEYEGDDMQERGQRRNNDRSRERRDDYEKEEDNDEWRMQVCVMWPCEE